MIIKLTIISFLSCDRLATTDVIICEKAWQAFSQLVSLSSMPFALLEETIDFASYKAARMLS